MSQASPLFHPGLESYLESLSDHQDTLLKEMEARARQEKFPIIGPVAGNFCYLIARLIGARQVFEMGSGFGYSTLWFARAVADNGGGQVHHTVWHQHLSEQAQHYFQRAGLPDSTQVHFHLGEAVSILRSQDHDAFDLIFVDIVTAGVKL